MTRIWKIILNDDRGFTYTHKITAKTINEAMDKIMKNFGGFGCWISKAELLAESDV